MGETTIKPETIVKNKTVVKKGAGKRVYIAVDMSIEDVLGYVDDGYDVRFEDKDKFRELPTDVYKELPLEIKERYMLAKELTMNGMNSVIATATDGLNGWSRDYDIQPGTPGEKLSIEGRDKAYNYRWERPDKIGKRGAEGFEVDKDPNVRTFGQPVSEIGKAVPKAVGGRKNSELLLLRRRKDVTAEFKRKKAEKLASYTTRAKDGFKEDVIRSGGKPTEE